jgi:hypothetical protein
MELLTSMYSLLLKYHDFVGILAPLPAEMVDYLGPDRPRASREKLQSWKDSLQKIDQKHNELIVAFEALGQLLDPAIRGNA